MDPNAVDMSAEMQDQIDARNAAQNGTAGAESAPAEPNILDTQTPPASESDLPEKKVSDSVPYERFKAVNDRLRQYESQPQPSYAPPPNQTSGQPYGGDIPQLDPEVLPAVRQVAWQVMEEQRAAEFIARHGTELQDPILRGAVSAIIQDANARRQVISQEDALRQAKSLLEERAKPKVEEATTQAFTEGQELARAKNRAGAVGETTAAAPPADPDKMNAAEFAKYMNIPRHTG